MAVLYAAIPLLFYFRVVPRQVNPLLVMLLAAAGAWFALWRNEAFDQRRLWNSEALRAGWRPTLLRAVVLCTFVGAGVWLFTPERLFLIVRRAPLLWAAIMVLYPLVSVYPQEVLFRAFFFERYRPLIGQGVGAVAAGALLFGGAHVVFGNWLSVVLSGAGGVLFARTYLRSGSLALASLEHALYGNFIFTIGLGEFFYHGTRR
jgi:hypothetical protein